MHWKRKNMTAILMILFTCILLMAGCGKEVAPPEETTAGTFEVTNGSTELTLFKSKRLSPKQVEDVTLPIPFQTFETNRQTLRGEEDVTTNIGGIHENKLYYYLNDILGNHVLYCYDIASGKVETVATRQASDITTGLFVTEEGLYWMDGKFIQDVGEEKHLSFLAYGDEEFIDITEHLPNWEGDLTFDRGRVYYMGIDSATGNQVIHCYDTGSEESSVIPLKAGISMGNASLIDQDILYSITVEENRYFIHTYHLTQKTNHVFLLPEDIAVTGMTVRNGQIIVTSMKNRVISTYLINLQQSQIQELTAFQELQPLNLVFISDNEVVFTTMDSTIGYYNLSTNAFCDVTEDFGFAPKEVLSYITPSFLGEFILNSIDGNKFCILRQTAD